MRLTVLSVAYPAAPVDADPVGGAEQIVAHLDRALVAAGHRSIVIACEGSRVNGTLISTPRPPEVLTPEVRRQLAANHRSAIATALQRYPVDIVHLHGIDCAAYLPQQSVPTLVTLHLPPSWYPRELFDDPHPRLTLNCVSHSQRFTCPPATHPIAVVENGVDVERHRPIARPGDHVLVLGRICPEKGQHLALQAARRAGVPLLIAGSVFPYPEHTDYFQSEVVPQLDDLRQFIGAVQGRRKTELLATARCVLIPSLAPETSSLVAMEALACGTSVVALRTGALPEVVEHGRTGIIVDSVDDMAAAIVATADLQRADCRHAAEQRFSAARMAERYLQLYQQILAAAPAAKPFVSSAVVVP